MALLAGRVAVVTGASAGIGAAIAYQLQDAGVNVVALARRKEKIQVDSLGKYKAKIGTCDVRGARRCTYGDFYGNVPIAAAAVDQARKDAQSRGRTSIGKVASPGKLHALKCDITQEEDIVNTFKWIKDNLGVAHIVVNNAGLGDSTQLDETNTARWQRVLDTNVLGLSICTREAIQLMRAKGVDYGHIIHIGSQVGHKSLSNPGILMYSASKHAVRVLTEGLRKELVAAKSKIRVTEVSPGFVESEFVNNGVVNEQTLKAYGLKEPKEIYNLVPHLKSEDVADAVLYAVTTPSHVQIHNVILGAVGETI